ncbi:unnamed protein product [Parajaminaea phylloscopi]
MQSGYLHRWLDGTGAAVATKYHRYAYIVVPGLEWTKSEASEVDEGSEAEGIECIVEGCRRSISSGFVGTATHVTALHGDSLARDGCGMDQAMHWTASRLAQGNSAQRALVPKTSTICAASFALEIPSSEPSTRWKAPQPQRVEGGQRASQAPSTRQIAHWSPMDVA